ncbi:protein RETARDED ROOT GROWTH, mitochondrial-like [Hordeum vulgare subsp. vulgare]|uniref:protein RETARDED ROOT GROWTH, mitochondrial-like n=1 Tax=Hordeum vulgare subsp. vulgare TaxID=112509 RepID=UPI001D1A4B67|nr:protein RETARDED ROOT GROWTH, mitochondrial-like [Hordeum vulgare subsp. vulgare]
MCYRLDSYGLGSGSRHPMTPAAPSQEEVEGPAHYIPVKAYFLSTSIDLKSLQAEHGTDVVPPSTRSLNYIALRYSVFPPEIMVSDFIVAPYILRVKNFIHV